MEQKEPNRRKGPLQDWIVVTTVLVENETKEDALEAAKYPGVQPASFVKAEAINVIDVIDLAVRYVKELSHAKD